MARRRAARGTSDVLPDRIPALDWVFGRCREVLETAGYREVRTPLFEETSLFVRSLGEATDVVAKEMFTVARGENPVSFRPEGTAGVVRAYLEHNLDKIRPFQKLYYMGPMFRFERPQAGRQRQFDQIGIEALGARTPLLDAEVVALAAACFDAVGLNNTTIALNTLGDAEDRARYREVLVAWARPQFDTRCPDCQVRLVKNPLRMLDCKVERCVTLNRDAPAFASILSAASSERFATTQAVLAELGVAFVVDPAIVRGLDYYTHTVFEVRCDDVGARSAVCGGGRYDGLIAELDGPQLGAVGFAIGVTPTLLALESQGHPAVRRGERSTPVWVVAVSDAERRAAFLLTHELRRAGIETDTDYEERSLRAQLKAVDKRGGRFALLLGGDEVQSGTVTLKDLAAGDEAAVHRGELVAELRRRLAAPAGSSPAP